MSVAFRLMSTGGAPPNVQWDSLRLEAESPLVLPLVPLDAQSSWKYDPIGTNLGTLWRWPGFDDADWPAGPALLGTEDCSCLPEAMRTALTVGAGRTTFYFRHRFTVPAAWTQAILRLRHVVDDGIVYYLNGAELFRLGVTNEPVRFEDVASRTVGDAGYEGPFDLTVTNLLAGDNVLAAEVHQASAASSDVVFGASLEALLYPHQLPGTNAVVRLERQDNILVVFWDEYRLVLEMAETITGPWAPAAEQNAPLILTATNSARFFRLRQ
jgi:hypothetical protein